MAAARGRQRSAFRLIAWAAFGLAGVAHIAADNRPAAPVEAVPANAAVPRNGRLIRIPLPLTGSADTQVIRAVEQAIARLPADGQRPV